MTFLHGVETISLKKGPRLIQTVRTAVIGIIGTAPIHTVTTLPAIELNKAELVLSDRDAARFGSADIEGYTLPKAIKAIQDQGAGTVFGINVFDPTLAAHRTTVASAVRNITNGEVQLPAVDLLSVTVTTAADAACVAGTDYTVDLLAGLITVLAGGNLAAAATCKVGYVKANPAGVLAADIIGTVTAGVRSGAQALLDCASRFGFGPKIIIAPGFTDETVVAALVVLAQKTKLRAIALADVPVGTSLPDVLTGRAPAGTVDLTASDKRLTWCWPQVKVTATEIGSYAARLAGVIAATDAEIGYWRSPSNRSILGIVGLELPVQASVNDPNSEANTVNAAGVTTIFSGYGISPRVWGNRSAGFPAETSIDTFTACLRVIDVVEESVELATLAYMDGPVGDVLITAVLDDVNAFMRTLISRGALMPGSRIEYFDEDNTTEELAAGHIVFTYTFAPPPPAERITYKSVVDTTLLTFGG
jgi:hypothetical protein